VDRARLHVRAPPTPPARRRRRRPPRLRHAAARVLVRVRVYIKCQLVARDSAHCRCIITPTHDATTSLCSM
jgi:hypothetical protein